MEIYGAYGKYLPEIKNEIMHKISELSHQIEKRDEEKLYEHLSGRVKQEESMIEKCQRKGLDLTPRSALNDCKDAIGIRVVCNFIDDIYKLVGLLKKQDWCDVIKEKDYVSKSKPNGYRSYHLIIKFNTSYPDINGHVPGDYYAEIQLRTIAMDSWASLEHELKYKHNIKNPEQIPESDSNETGETIKRISKIKEMGYEIALDDVGMGMNTLAFLLANTNHIKRLKLSIVPFKMESLVLLIKFWKLVANEAKVELVIEGIDSEKMRTMVHQAGVKMQQGFLWKSQFIFLY